MGPLPSPTPTQIGVAGLDSHCGAHIPATITGNNCRRIRTPPRLRLLELPVKLRRHPLGLDPPSSPCCSSHTLTHLGIASSHTLSASSSAVFFTGVVKSSFVPKPLPPSASPAPAPPLPVDALHGDISVLLPGDLLVLISSNKS